MRMPCCTSAGLLGATTPNRFFDALGTFLPTLGGGGIGFDPGGGGGPPGWPGDGARGVHPTCGGGGPSGGDPLLPGGGGPPPCCGVFIDDESARFGEACGTYAQDYRPLAAETIAPPLLPLPQVGHRGCRWQCCSRSRLTPLLAAPAEVPCGILSRLPAANLPRTRRRSQRLSRGTTLPSLTPALPRTCAAGSGSCQGEDAAASLPGLRLRHGASPGAACALPLARPADAERRLPAGG